MSDATPSGGVPTFTVGTPRSPEFQDFYCNQARVTITLSDINIIFGATNDRGPGILTLEDRVSIRLAPMTAKILSAHLHALMRAYESVVGEIPMPAAVASQIDVQMQNLSQGLAAQMGTPPQTSS
jgi:hypothetical protein